VGVAGYVPFVARLVAHSRRTGASATVLASLYTRYMQHLLGTRHDEAAARLVRAMPSVSPAGLWLTTRPSSVAHRLTGYVPRIYRYPYPGQPPLAHQSASRTTFYDQTVERYLPRIEQLVILGAGFDTRGYRLPGSTRVHCFEIDEPKTQASKREVLRVAGIDTSRVAFVAADFERDDWYDKLLEAGFDPTRRTLFTWESVTMYLERAAVEGTLRTIAHTAPGSAVAFDYVSAELLHARSPFMRYARAIINATGEPWKFGIDNTPPVRDRVAEFVARCGLRLEEQRDFGPETNGRRAPAGFAVAVVPERS
jgi:methyltransferase (TIGR00027 family)